MAYRRRHKQERVVEDVAQPSVTAVEDDEAPPRVTVRRTKTERQWASIRDEKQSAAPVSDSVMRPPRVAFAEQVRKQQPEGVAGYRLVLPTRSPADTPKIVPVPDSQGGIRYWRINPFEIPDDIRLQEGHSYRILWVDGSGQPLAPTAPYVPSLFFFLGPPDSEQDDRDAAYASILRDVRDPENRKQIEAEIAQSRLETQQQRERDEELKQKLDRTDRLQRIQSRQLDEQRRREREDRAERERLESRQQERIAKEKDEREQKDEREMWTALKVMGGFAAVVAVGWGPVVRFLDSLQEQPEAGRTLGPLLQKVGSALSAQKSGATQSPAQAHSDGGVGKQTAQATETPGATVQPTNPSPAPVPSVPPAPSQPAATASAAMGAQSPPQDEKAAQQPSAIQSEQPGGGASLAPLPIPVQVPVASPTPNQSSSETPTLDESLSDGQIQRLCGIVLDPNRMAQVLYENECTKASMLGSPLPPAPSLDLSPDELKEIRAVLSSRILCDALLSLWTRFRAAAAGGGDAMFALPPPFQSLQPNDRDRIHRTIATPEQRDYFIFQSQRRDAALRGLPMPRARPTGVTDKEQKAIRRLFRDERVMVYLSTSGVLSS